MRTAKKRTKSGPTYRPISPAMLMKALQDLIDDTRCTFGDPAGECLCPHCNGKYILENYKRNIKEGI